MTYTAIAAGTIALAGEASASWTGSQDTAIFGLCPTHMSAIRGNSIGRKEVVGEVPAKPLTIRFPNADLSR